MTAQSTKPISHVPRQLTYKLKASIKALPGKSLSLAGIFIQFGSSLRDRGKSASGRNIPLCFLPDAESLDFGQTDLGLVNSSNLNLTGIQLHQADQLIDLLQITLQDCLDLTVSQIMNPAIQTHFFSVFTQCPAKTDTLDPSGKYQLV
jgi:hypothetical protein